MKRCAHFSLLAILILSSCSYISKPNSFAPSTPVTSNTPEPTFTPPPTETSTSLPTAIPVTIADTPTPVNSLPRTYNGLLAFTSNQDGDLDIYTMNADGSRLTNLTNNPARDVNPSWSPDGRYIAFESDRTGFMQIYLMHADGSNVIQLTDAETNHAIGVDFGAFFDPWSPDGGRLIFSQKFAEEENWMLYTIDTNGENIKPLVNKPGKYGSPSWAPDGQHISYAALESEENQNVSRIYIVDANGGNRTNITRLLPADEAIVFWRIYWSSDGQSVLFIAGRTRYQGENSKYTVYEASLNGETLIERIKSSMPIHSWQEETTIVTDISVKTMTWLRPDGTSSTLDLFGKCQTNSVDGYGSTYRSSSDGSLFVGAHCPNGDWWFYWANPNGTLIRSLPNLLVPLMESSPGNIVWSPNNTFIAFNVAFSDRTNLYIWNLNDSLKDPSIQPLVTTVGSDSFYYRLAWQPIP